MPHHIGVEPKAKFTIGAETYEPLSDEGAAILAVFGALSDIELAAAYLSGEMC